ncbi:RNA exonuclease [Pancytospora philotis]|nr:RNA exonuclease [Pancytospora philotis]
MAGVRTPRYFKLHDIQLILRYMFNGHKRPNFIQLKRMPSVAVLLKVDAHVPSSSVEQMQPERQQATCNAGCSTARSMRNPHLDISRGTSSLSSDARRTISGALDALGMNRRIHINENFSLDFAFSNVLKDMEVYQPNLACITEEALRLVEKQDVKHLFSYTEYIKSQTTFDESTFDSFARPSRASSHFLVAIDCEMMTTVEGSHIGRATVLDRTGAVLYDKYVRPGAQVLDYLEKYSGLNQDNTAAGISYGTLRRELLEIIGTNTYVLGHGLENDLNALRIYTENVIDTAYLFLSSEGYKIKLKQLSVKYLNERIQGETHSSHEDSLCCLKLLAYKIQQVQLLADPDTPLIGLDGAVLTGEAASDFIEKHLRKQGTALPTDERCLVRSTITLGDMQSLKSDRDVFYLVFYEDDGNSYVAFRQPE